MLESKASRWLCASRLDENGAVGRRLENSSTTLSVFFKRGNKINIFKHLGFEHVHFKFNSEIIVTCKMTLLMHKYVMLGLFPV